MAQDREELLERAKERAWDQYTDTVSRGAFVAGFEYALSTPTPPAQGDVRERADLAMVAYRWLAAFHDREPSTEPNANDLQGMIDAILAALTRTGEPVAWARMRGGIVNHVVTEPREGYQPLFAHPVPEQDGWRSKDSLPHPSDAGEFLAAIRVRSRGGPLRWKVHLIALDDETHDVHPDYERGWSWDDYELWMPSTLPLPQQEAV